MKTFRFSCLIPRDGFTLLELVLSLGILVLVGSLVLASFVNSRKLRDLTTSGQSVLSYLQLAQSKTLAGEGNSSWGVHLQSDRVTLFRGISFAGATSTEIYLLPDSIELVNLNLLGGGSDVVFRRLDGRTDQSGSLDLRVKSVLTHTFPISIDPSGKVYRSASSANPIGTRIVDTRHRVFDLGWSLQNSTTLALRFSDPPNPDTVQNIAMAPYVSADKSRFDWSGNVAVGGQNQTLRIHTILLTANATRLSVDRDCRTNTKKLNIQIDANAIATYEADCVTLTVGAQGGTVSEP